MDGCHSEDTSHKSGAQTLIWEGNESVLGRTEKQRQRRESHSHSEMWIAFCTPETMQTYSFDQNPRPEWKLYSHSEGVQGWRSSVLRHTYPGSINWSYCFLEHFLQGSRKLNKVGAQQKPISHWMWEVKIWLLECCPPLP